MKKLFTLLLLTILPVFAMAEGGSPVVIDGISYKFAEMFLKQKSFQMNLQSIQVMS